MCGPGFFFWMGRVALASALADRDNPALGIRQSAPLDAGHGVVELLSQGADLTVIDEGGLILIVQLLDGRDYGGSAGAEDLPSLPSLEAVMMVSMASLPSMTS